MSNNNFEKITFKTKDFEYVFEENGVTDKNNKKRSYIPYILFKNIELVKNKSSNNFFSQMFNSNKSVLLIEYDDIIDHKTNKISIEINDREISSVSYLVEYITKILAKEKMKALKPYDYTFDFFESRKSLDEYILFDIETTGLSYDKDKIIEFSLVKVKNGTIVDSYSSLVNPKMHIPLLIEELTGITNEMIKDQKDISSHINYISNFINDSVIVGHNVSFDLSFLKPLLIEEIIEKNNNLIKIDKLKYIDTLSLVKLLDFPTKNNKLETIKKYLKIKDISHRSLNDCYTTNELFVYCQMLLDLNMSAREFSNNNKINEEEQEIFNIILNKSKKHDANFRFNVMSSNVINFYDDNLEYKTDFIRIKLRGKKKMLYYRDKEKGFTWLEINDKQEIIKKLDSLLTEYYEQ